MPKAKKIIFSHKGGRTERFTGRLTPDEKLSLEIVLRIESIRARKKVSLSDWIVSQIHPASPTYWEDVLVDVEEGDFDPPGGRGKAAGE